VKAAFQWKINGQNLPTFLLKTRCGAAERGETLLVL